MKAELDENESPCGKLRSICYEFLVKKAFVWLFLPVLLLSLAGCGGGGGGGTTSISGKVIDGPVSGASIIVYQVTSSGLTQAGTGYTQSDGSFALTINNYNSSDYYLLYVSGGTFSNNGSSTAAPTMVGFLVPGGTPTVYITPLTTLIGEALFNADGTINTSLNSAQVDFYLKQMLYYIGQLFNGMSGSNLNGISSSDPAQSQLITELLTLLQDLANDVAGQAGEKYGQAMQDLLNYLSYPNNGAKAALLAALTGNGGNGNFTFNGFQFTGNGGGTANISGTLNNNDQAGFTNAETPPSLPSGLKNIPAAFSVPPVSMWIASGDGTVRKLDSSGNVSGPYNVGPGPDSIAVDSNGNAWVAGAGVVTELSPAGASEQTCYLHTGTSSGLEPDYEDSNFVAVDYSNNVWVTSSVGYDYTPVTETTPPRSYPGWGDGEGGYYENGTSQIYDWWDGAIIELNTASCGLNQSQSPYIRYFNTYSGSGGSISGPGELAVDHSGNLWVKALEGGFPTYGESFEVGIAEFSSSTGNLISLPGGVPDPGLQNFNSIATDPAGNLWAFAGFYAPMNYGTPNLSEIKPGGTVANYAVQSAGSLNADFLVPSNGFPIAADPSGNIWIAMNVSQYVNSKYVTSTTVYEYSQAGSLVKSFVLSNFVPGFYVSQASEQIAFDPSGNAWVIGKSDTGADGVIVINPATNGLAFFQVPDPVAITSGSYTLSAPGVSSVSPAKNATGVSTSSAVKVTFGAAMNSSTVNSGTFTLTGPNGTQVTGAVTFDASTNAATFTPSFPLSTGTSYTATITTGAYGADNVAFASAYSWSFTTTSPSVGGTNTFTAGTHPLGIAIDASGHIWVANSGDGTVEEMDSSGSVIGTFGGGNITGAGYIAIDASGNVWVTGTGTSITELLKSSGYATSAAFNMATPSMTGPGGIAIDASGNVWVTNTYTGTMTNLYEFLSPNYTSSTTFSTGFGGGVATGLAIDASSNVWVGYNDYGYGEVTELLSSNSYSSNSGNSFPGNITGPEGLAIDASGNAWVTNLAASAGNSGTVVKLIAPSTSSSPYAAGIAPEGIAIDSSGNIWVANNGSGTVTELNSSGNIVKTYSVGTNPVDVAIDSSGNVWVTNYGDGTVSELVGVATGPQFFPYSGPQFP